jgi:FO synthase
VGEDGHEGALPPACNAGANDLGGTLMNESITRAAGAQHGQETSPQRMRELVVGAGRTLRQRTTLYAEASAERQLVAASAAPLLDIVNTPVRRKTELVA